MSPADIFGTLEFLLTTRALWYASKGCCCRRWPSYRNFSPHFLLFVWANVVSLVLCMAKGILRMILIRNTSNVCIRHVYYKRIRLNSIWNQSHAQIAGEGRKDQRCYREFIKTVEYGCKRQELLPLRMLQNNTIIDFEVLLLIFNIIHIVEVLDFKIKFIK